MRFLVAPDSFKGCLTARKAGQIIQSALIRELPDAKVDVIPMADGGEGMLDSFLFSTKVHLEKLEVMGPTGEKIQAHYGVLDEEKTVIIESAAVVGYTLVPKDKRNPDHLTTYGIGECILHALDKGYRRFIVGIGGSATNDAGFGMLQALGVSFLDNVGNEVPPFPSSMEYVESVNYSTIDPRIKEAEIQVARDVDNPLCGPTGSSYVFSQQKGAKPEQVENLDRALALFAKRIERHLGETFQHEPGAGAAGGLGFALLTIGGKLQSGAALIASAVGIERHLQLADWLITGEGKTDSQTLRGKVPYYLASLAASYHVPVILISGSLEGNLEELYPFFDSMHAIGNGPISLDESMKNAESLLYHKTRNIVRLLK